MGGVGCTVCPPRETRGAASLAWQRPLPPAPSPPSEVALNAGRSGGRGVGGVGGGGVACCHTMSNQYELPRAVGPPRHISGKVAPLRRDGCSFEIHFNASPQHSHMAPFSGTPGNGLLCRDQGEKKRPHGRSPTIAARVAPLSDFFIYFFFTTCLGHRLENLPEKPFVFNTRPRAAISRELLLECKMQVPPPTDARKEALGRKKKKLRVVRLPNGERGAALQPASHPGG